MCPLIWQPLRESDKGQTAVYCADGILSGPSAQFGRQAGPEEDRRHRLAVGIGAAVPTATVGYQQPSA
jgi:hypothetical protein